MVFFLDLVFICWSAAVTQLRVVVVTKGTTSLQLVDSVRAQEMRSVSAAEEFEVLVRNSSPSPRPVVVAPLRTAHDALLGDPATYIANGDFAVVGDLRRDGVWRAAESGSELTWRGRVTGLTVTLLCGPHQGSACVSSNVSGETCYDLAQCAGQVSLAIPNSRTIHYGLAPLWRGGLAISSARPIEIERIVVSFGTQTLYERDAFELEGSTALEPFASTRGRAILELIWGGLTLLAQLALVIGAMVLAGASLVTPVVHRFSLTEALLLAFFAGEGLTANATTSLFHFVSANAAWHWVWVSLAAVVAVQLVAGGWRKWLHAAKSTGRDESQALTILVVVATAGCLVMAFPAVAFPDWYLGHVYTDSVDYASWASLAREGAIDRTLGAIRFEDFVRLAVTANTLGIDTRGALAPQMLVLWWTLPFLGFALMRRFGFDFGTALVGAALAVHASVFFEIATQCYLPQYEAAHFILASVWAAAWFVADGVVGEGWRQRFWPELALAAVFSASVGLYPYQAFGVIAFGLVAVVGALIRRSSTELLGAIRVGLMVMFVCNLNLEVVFDFTRESMQHREALNTIGKWVVFPWYQSPEARLILVGAEDFVRNSAHGADVSSELLAMMPSAHLGFEIIDRGVRAIAPVVACALPLFAMAALIWLLRRRDRASLVALGALAILIVMAAGLVFTNDVYFWVKSLMSLAALLVIPVSGLIARIALSPVPALSLPSTALVVAFVMVNLRTAWFESVGYFVSRESSVLARSRTNLPIAGESMFRFQAFVDRLPRQQRFVLLGKLHERYSPDGDIVTYNLILQALEGHSVTYEQGAHKRYTRSRDVGYRGSQSLSEFDWLISFDKCSPPKGAVIEFQTELFCVWRSELRG